MDDSKSVILTRYDPDDDSRSQKHYRLTSVHVLNESRTSANPKSKGRAEETYSRRLDFLTTDDETANIHSEFSFVDEYYKHKDAKRKSNMLRSSIKRKQD